MEKEKLIEEILNYEFEMFQTVSTDQRASCQDDFESFCVMRGSQFSAWSMETLASYCYDLEEAKSQGKNLMTLKYARMDNLIPPLTQNELIGKIADIQLSWQREMIARYPGFMSRGRPLDESREARETSFLTYLKGELETYGDMTLHNLYKDMLEVQSKGGNMNIAVYENMVRKLGYSSLDEAETEIKNKEKQ